MKNNMKLLDGKLLSEKIKDDVKAIADSYKKTPILAIISIGEDELSKIYINNKKKACEQVGISLIHFNFASRTKQSTIIKSIKDLNKDKNVNGISVELPILDNYDEDKIINSIDPNKDVECLTSINQGKLLHNTSKFIPCNVLALLELFDFYNINLEDKKVLIIGNDNLVCKPFMIECIRKSVDVMVSSKDNSKLKEFTKIADVIISAVNKKYLINNNMIKEGCVIIDMGVSKENDKVYGDVNPNVKTKASFLTPRIGGVGPVCISMLLKNTIKSYLDMNKDN